MRISYSEIVKVLLKYNGNLNAVTVKHGLTAMDFAFRRNDTVIINILQKRIVSFFCSNEIEIKLNEIMSKIDPLNHVLSNQILNKKIPGRPDSVINIANKNSDIVFFFLTNAYLESAKFRKDIELIQLERKSIIFVLVENINIKYEYKLNLNDFLVININESIIDLELNNEAISKSNIFFNRITGAQNCSRNNLVDLKFFKKNNKNNTNVFNKFEIISK